LSTATERFDIIFTSLGTSHDPIQYMAEISSRTSNQTRNAWFRPRQIATHSEHWYSQWPAR